MPLPGRLCDLCRVPQVSFVNGICTVKGGQHVSHVADQVVQKLMAAVKKKNKVPWVAQSSQHLHTSPYSLAHTPAYLPTYLPCPPSPQVSPILRLSCTSTCR
jgi:hypothetical protein